MNRPRRNALTLATTLAVGFVLTTAFAQTPSLKPTPSPRTQQVRGHVTPSRQVVLMAPLEEILRQIEVAEGDRVVTGERLAQLDDRLQEVVVESARLRAESEAEVQRTALDLQEAKENLQMLTDAHQRGAATDMEMRRVRTEAGRAEAIHTEALENRTLAEVNLKLEERRLARYRITAPFDGTVVRVAAEVGAMLTSEDAILILADLDTLEAQVNLPAEVYGELTLGRSYTLAAEAPVHAELTGVLQSIDPIIDTASHTFRCVLAIDNRQAGLPAGFTVSMEWPQGEASDGMTVTGEIDRPE